MRSIILVIDAGSSSIRCIAHEYRGVVKSGNTRASPPLDIDEHMRTIVSSSSSSASAFSCSSTSSTSNPQLVDALKGIGHSIPLCAIHPSTGHIRVHEVLDAIDTCIDETLRALRREENWMHRVVAVGFSTFVMNLVAVDIQGDPVGEVATCSYACNRRDVKEECERLRTELGLEKLKTLHQRTGAPLHVSYALPQLRAFYANPANRPLAEQIDQWRTLSTICLHRWSGKPSIHIPISYSEASWTGLLDFRTCSWDDEAVDLVQTCPGITRYEGSFEEGDEVYKDTDIEILPPLADFDAPLPFLREGVPKFNHDGSVNVYWERWPEFRSHLLCQFLGIGDGAAANFGTKCGGGRSASSGGGRQQQRIAVTIGTSAAARVCLPLSITSSSVSDTVSVPPGLFCYRAHRDTILLGGALTDGGSVVEWARSLLNLQSPELFDACLTQVTDMYVERCSGSSLRDDNVTMIPFLSGERSPGYRDNIRGCISGLTRGTTSNTVIHACLESVVLRLGRVLHLIIEACASRRLLRDVAEVGKSSDGDVESILVTSGTALERNALWRQMLADCTSVDVIVDSDSAEEATSRGVAILLAASLQQTGQGSSREAMFADNDEQLLVIAKETKCNATAEEYWKAAAISQESLIEAIANI